MKYYKVTVMADRYPTEYRVEASSWSTAAARALRLWQKRFKRSRADTVKLSIICGGTVVDRGVTVG